MRFFFFVFFVSFFSFNTHAELIRDDIKEIVIDTQTKLMWQDDISVETVQKTQTDAISYCSNKDIAGYTDWRLPSREELLSIVRPHSTNPAISPVFLFRKPHVFWSSTNIFTFSSLYYAVSFSLGDTAAYRQNNMYYVRCVANQSH